MVGLLLEKRNNFIIYNKFYWYFKFGMLFLFLFCFCFYFVFIFIMFLFLFCGLDAPKKAPQKEGGSRRRWWVTVGKKK